MAATRDLTRGNVTATMLLFALPLILGNLLQQFYNIADTLIVGRFLGAQALAAVGSSYTLMIFLNSIILGMCMGCGILFSICWGRGDLPALRNNVFISFVLIGAFSLLLNAVVFLLLEDILVWLQVPADVMEPMGTYLWYIFWGILFTFLYNYLASLLRAVGNSAVPLVFLGASAVVNIVLDLLFIISMDWGVAGAAIATVIAQALAAVGLAAYTLVKAPQLLPGSGDLRFEWPVASQVLRFASFTCMQQSVMNFGILMVQGLVNSFGTVIMAAFAAAVKIDSFAYMPVQDFGNAFSTFIAQNVGAKKFERIKQGIRSAFVTSIIFSCVVSALVWIYAADLMEIFVQPEEHAIVDAGVQYLRIEGSFYCGIGCLFLFYGLYRAVKLPEMSLVLTVISLGTRVALAYWLAAVPGIGVLGIWWAVPIGWALADLTGAVYYWKNKEHLQEKLSA